MFPKTRLMSRDDQAFSAVAPKEAFKCIQIIMGIQGCISYHVLQVNEGVIDGHDLDALLKASPQDQTANAAKASRRRERGIIMVAVGNETSSDVKALLGPQMNPLMNSQTITSYVITFHIIQWFTRDTSKKNPHQ